MTTFTEKQESLLSELLADFNGDAEDLLAVIPGWLAKDTDSRLNSSEYFLRFYTTHLR